MSSAMNMGIVITLLFLCTVVSITLGGIAWSRINLLFLPFPTVLGALSTLYPFLPFLPALIANILASRYQLQSDDNTRKNRITSGSSSDRNGNNGNTVPAADIDTKVNWLSQDSRSFISSLYPVANTTIDHLLTLVPIIVATLAATYIAPSDNNCHLEQTWQSYYHNKNVNSIRTIQDQLQCCGLRSTRDRAWPFKDAIHGDDSCERTAGYTRSCLQPWSEQERRVAVMVFAAAVIGWGIKLGVVYVNPRNLYAIYNSRTRRNAWTNGVHDGPRMLPYRDTAYENGDTIDEEALDEGPQVGEDSLLNPDEQDPNSPEDRDFTGSGPWR